MNDSDHQKKTYTFPSSIDYLEKVESLSVKIARKAGFNESTIDDLSIALTELVNNAIHHGNNDDITKNVTVTFDLDQKDLSITIKDEGSGFDPDQLKNPLDPENLLAESGRGLYLVKALMDDIKFKITEQGTEITIIKRLNKGR
jgi:serine/threonine-protein kinase RsbW